MLARKQRLFHHLFARNKRDLLAYIARRAGREEAVSSYREVLRKNIRVSAPPIG